MSIKGVTFQENLGNPLNTHNFIVRFAGSPQLESIQMMVSSTTFPSEVLQEYELYFQGERFKFPSLPRSDGKWSCTMPEGERAKMQKALEEHMALQYNQQTGQLLHWAVTDKFTIDVIARGLRGGADDPDSEVFGVRMIGAFMVGKGPVNLDNSAITTHWNWSVEFSYDWLENIPAKPLDKP
jgi:hypothetical protein